MIDRSKVYRFIAGAALALAVAAPAASVSAQQLEVWALSGPEGTYFEQALKRFEAANPGVTGKLSTYPNEQYKTAVDVGLTSANPPDVFRNWSFERAHRLVRAGLATDIADFSKEVPAGALSEYTFDGKLYGVPFDRHGKYMWYNKAFFAANNMSAPKTFDELLAMCKAVKTIDAGMIPIALGASEPWTIDAYIAIFNQKLVPDDVRVADANLTSPADTLFTDPGYVEALDKFKQMQTEGCFNDGINAMTPEATRTVFASGASAMTLCGTWCLVVFDTEGLANGYLGFRMPDFEGQKGKPNGHLVIEDGVQISTNTRTKGTYELANKFLHFLVTPQEQAEFVKVAGSLPAIPESLQYLDNVSEALKFAVEDTAKADVIATHLDTILDRELSDVYLRGYQELVNDTKTSAQIMQEVHAKAVEVQAARK